MALLKPNDVSSNRYSALALCLSMIFSENRFALFGIMLPSTRQQPRKRGNSG
jgi:hypothetical protein